MAHLLGTFSDLRAGRLRVTLTGDFFLGATVRRDAGFPSVPGAGDPNWVVRAFIGLSDSYKYTTPIDRFSAAAQIELDYPGGGVVWTLGTETVSSVTSGLTPVGIANLRLAGALLVR